MSPTTEQPITIRIVLDGAPLAGKTTVTHSVAAALGDAVAVPSQEGGLTGSFDWGSYTDGEYTGETVDVEIVNVPAQRNLVDRRHELLAWGDVIIFVSDSTAPVIATSSDKLGELRAELEEIGDKPIIVIANKRDLGNAIGLDELRRELNLGDADVVVESIATAGVGVPLATVHSVRAALTAEGHRFEAPVAAPVLKALDVALNTNETGAGELPLSGSSSITFSHWDNLPTQASAYGEQSSDDAMNASDWQQINAIEEASDPSVDTTEDTVDEPVDEAHAPIAEDTGSEDATSEDAISEELPAAPERKSFFGGLIPSTSTAAEEIASSDPVDDEPERKSFFGSGVAKDTPERKSFFGSGVAEETTSFAPTPTPTPAPEPEPGESYVDADGWTTYVPEDGLETNVASAPPPPVMPERDSFFGGPALAAAAPTADAVEELDETSEPEVFETGMALGEPELLDDFELLDEVEDTESSVFTEDTALADEVALADEPVLEEELHSDEPVLEEELHSDEPELLEEDLEIHDEAELSEDTALADEAVFKEAQLTGEAEAEAEAEAELADEPVLEDAQLTEATSLVEDTDVESELLEAPDMDVESAPAPPIIPKKSSFFGAVFGTVLGSDESDESAVEEQPLVDEAIEADVASESDELPSGELSNELNDELNDESAAITDDHIESSETEGSGYFNGLTPAEEESESEFVAEVEESESEFVAEVEESESEFVAEVEESEPEPEQTSMGGYPFQVAPPLLTDNNTVGGNTVDEDAAAFPQTATFETETETTSLPVPAILPLPEVAAKAEPNPIVPLPERSSASTEVVDDSEDSEEEGETTDKNSRYRALKALRQTLR